ncbi:hypothetical protein lam_087 [Candidatus Liberibacter americanus str. Sao Paulo]|uniref:Uncharacterized protein n=1 Tax=Candidatus Liberibacter americanus str. Sao Paulo TaxID=1261131 RepID=U6B332_9HYPH|nr:hypothetical protein lam_087 [Candidatus Liberibacter americanus str. Sao Paulo]
MSTTLESVSSSLSSRRTSSFSMSISGAYSKSRLALSFLDSEFSSSSEDLCLAKDFASMFSVILHSSLSSVFDAFSKYDRENEVLV